MKSVLIVLFKKPKAVICTNIVTTFYAGWNMALQLKRTYIQEQAQWDLSLIFFLFSLVIWCKGKKSSEKKKSVFWFFFFLMSLDLPLGKFILSITWIKCRPNCHVFFKIDNKWNIRSECDWVFLILISWLA